MNELVSTELSSPLFDNCPATLPASFSFDATHFVSEQKQIWARNWVYAGRENDLPAINATASFSRRRDLILVKICG